MSTHHHLRAGFSLVETLVAITILLIIIVGPMTLISSSARSTDFASDQVTAFFLAQEGAELAQKARDDYVLQQFLQSGAVANPWANFIRTQSPNASLYTSCFAASGCGLYISNEDDGEVTPVSCATSGSCRLQLNVGDVDGSVTQNENRARYSYTAGSQTPFTRRIFFTASGNQIRVRSEVTWYTGAQTAEQRTVVETYLYNIYGN